MEMAMGLACFRAEDRKRAEEHLRKGDGFQ